MKKLADISIFNSLCASARINNGWQSTEDQRKSYLGMSRGGILHALQMLSSSTIGYDPRQVAQFIQGVMQEFYQKNPNGHIHKEEPKLVQRTGLIRREQQSEYGPSRDGVAATPEELMDSCSQKLRNVKSIIDRGIHDQKTARAVKQTLNIAGDYIVQLYNYNKKTPVNGFREWYSYAYPKYRETASDLMMLLKAKPPQR